HPERSAQTDVEHQIPRFVLALPDMFELVDTCVVEQDIDSTEALDGFFHRRFDLLAPGNVNQHPGHRAPEFRAQLLRGFGRAPRMRVGKHHFRAFFHETGGYSAPDPGARARSDY